MTFTKTLTGAMLVSAAVFAQDAFADGLQGTIKHVLLISVDGLHDADLTAYATANPASAMATLAGMAVHYTNAKSAMPSDSFPGLLAIVTGGSPKSTGVFYDDSYDRALSAPGSDCSVKGTEVVYDESIDMKPESVDAGGMNLDLLPRDGANGCVPFLPHQFLRVNTVFEVIKAAGGLTAWADKHPAYDLVNGPSGKGVDDLYTPEINVGKTTDTVAATEAYDDLKVTAVLNQIAGKSSDGAASPGVPMIYGMNFQAVSVGEKTKGYTDAKGTPSPELADALKHTDESLGKFLAAIKAAGNDKDTLIIVSAKHGQSPMDPAQLKIVDKKGIGAVLDAVSPGLVAQLTADDVALIWLTDQSKTAAAAAALNAAKADLHIAEVMDAAAVGAMFGDAMKDSRVPDLVILPETGVIYTKPTATKIAEHGGFSEGDVHVPVLVAGPGIAAQTVTDAVATMNIAPTILAALGMDPMALQAVKAEGTAVLPGLGLK